MKPFFFILVLTWFPGILSSQNHLVLNSQSEKSDQQDPGSANIQYLSGLPYEIRWPELRNSGLCDLSIIHDKYMALSPFGLNPERSKLFFLDLKTFVISSFLSKGKAKDMENNTNQSENMDSYYYDESLEESICSDRIITIAGEYLLTDINYSMAGKTCNK